MSHKQDTWDDIIQIWNENDAGINKQVPPENVLVDQIHKQSRNNKIEAILSIVVNTPIAGYIIFEMLSGLPSIADVILYSVFLIIALSFVVYGLISAKSVISVSTDSTLNHSQALFKQHKIELNTLLLSRIVCALVCLTSLSLVGLIAYVAMFGDAFEFKHYLVGGIALGSSLFSAIMFIWLKEMIIQRERQLEFLICFDVLSRHSLNM